MPPHNLPNNVVVMPPRDYPVGVRFIDPAELARATQDVGMLEAYDEHEATVSEMESVVAAAVCGFVFGLLVTVGLAWIIAKVFLS